MLSNVKFVQEKRLISKFFDEISQDTGKFVFSVKVGAWLFSGAEWGRGKGGWCLPCATGPQSRV
jgi:hypothetical protein